MSSLKQAILPRPWCRMVDLKAGENERLPENYAPFVRKEVRIEKNGKAISKIVGPAHEYAIEDPGAGEAFADLLALCNGENTLKKLAATLQMDIDDITSAIQDLYLHGLVSDRCEALIPPITYFNHLCATADYYVPLQPHPTFDAAAGGKLTARQVIGDLVRVWLGTRYQASHIAIAISRGVSDRSQHAWSRLLAEEYEHQFWLSEGLEKWLTHEEMRRARPLPMQQAVLNTARAAAMQDELAYAACNILNETSEDAGMYAGAPNVDWYRGVMEQNLVPKEVIEPELRHVTFDAQRRHQELVRVAFEENGPVPLARRRIVLGHMMDLIYLAAAMEQEEFRFYSNPENPRVFMGIEELEVPWVNPTSEEEVKTIRTESVWLPATEGGKHPYTRPQP